MPLDKSGSASSFGNNVKKEMQSGKPQNQAVAIAYSVNGQRKAAPKDRYKKLSEFVKGPKNLKY